MNNCYRKKTVLSKPASTPESAIMPSKTSTQHTTCWKGLLKMTIPTSTFSIIWKEDGVTYLETAVSLAMPSDSVMSRLYVGLADCYKMAFQYTDQANTLLTQYEKYDRQKHKLLYDAAFIYYYYLKDASKAERYLTAYLKTRPKNSKDKVQEVDADGVPIIGEDNRYNAAENWLKDIREKRKKEDFFKGKVDTASVTPIK